MEKPRKKWILVVGARPNFIKIAALTNAIQAYNKTNVVKINPVLVHTGQHYDIGMSDYFFRDLNLPHPDFHLEVGSGRHGEQIGKILIEFEKVVILEQPELVVVVGDVNSTLACALTASKLHIPLAHIEAGLRSFDRTMPEEINRLLTDSVSDYLFTPSEDANANLRREGISEDRIYFVGNVMIDTLRMYENEARSKAPYKEYELRPKEYAVLTLHRPSNVDNNETLQKIVSSMAQIQGRLPVLFPAHPRTLNRLQESGLFDTLVGMRNLRLCKPIGYLEFLGLLTEARLVFTDSGGIQEETTALGIPCLTLRETTERPVTVSYGSNNIVGTNPKLILSRFEAIMSNSMPSISTPPLWDGHTSERIVKLLVMDEKQRKIGVDGAPD